MFRLGKKKVTGPSFTTDIHCHILPGLDDGAATLDQSLEMADNMARAGIKEIYATPHIKADIYSNDRNTIEEAAKDFSSRLIQNNIGIKLNFAAEYFIDMFFIEKLESSEPLLTLKDNYILVESSMRHEPMFLFDVLFKLQAKGYRPVMAHPERYVYYGKDPAPYRKLKKAGCLFQLNLFSFAGYYGSEVKGIARMLAKNGLGDFIGTDAHKPEHAVRVHEISVLTNTGGFTPANDPVFGTGL